MAASRPSIVVSKLLHFNWQYPRALDAQGFVSNKDTDTTGERGDPIEGLLYAIVVASTDRADVASLVRFDPLAHRA